MLVVTRGVLAQKQSVRRLRDAAWTNFQKTGGEARMLHKVEELKWVVLWILVTVFVFAIFIPTVNRALNL
jgi:hypothetical protein